MVAGFLKSALVLVGVTKASAAGCAGAWKECTEEQCCSTPYFECVQRNKDGAKRKDGKGKTLKAYAQCRAREGTGHGWDLKSCPCDINSNSGGMRQGQKTCVDYGDYKTPENERVTWNCVVLTGGCNAAYKPCGVALGWDNETQKTWMDNPQNIGCCHWGCECKYSKKEVATCQPPKGMFACNKGDEAKAKANQGDEKTPSVREEEEALGSKDEAMFKSLGISDDDLAALDDYEVSKDQQPIAESVQNRVWAWLLAGAGAVAMVTVSIAVTRKTRSQRVAYLDTSLEMGSAE